MPKRILYYCEAEVTPGLEFITEAELREFGAENIQPHSGEIDFHFAGNLAMLLNLKTVQSVSLMQSFDVPRPRALLSNVHFPLLLRQIEVARSLVSSDTYHTFYIAAAGAESSIMQRIKAALTDEMGLRVSDDKGDLWIRIRPARVGGWETLVRLSPRPLVTRPWRVCNLEGALNAATAQAMIRLLRPQANDVFVNLGCGSGTLLIERLAYGRCDLAIGIDNQPAHLRCAQTNVSASGFTNISLQIADMIELPLHTASVSTLCADLPFGQLSGSHRENQQFYPLMLGEAARIAQMGARFVLMTHEIRLMDGLLQDNENWAVEQSIQVNLRGLHPRIYVLRRLTSST